MTNNNNSNTTTISAADLAKAKEYRERASSIRQAAEYADRLESAKHDLQQATWYSYQADVLEGKIKPRAPRADQKTPEQRQAERRQNHQRAMAELTAFFSPKPKSPAV